MLQPIDGGWRLGSDAVFNWQQLDTLTRVGVVATAAMIFFLIIPPLALLAGLVSIVVSAMAFRAAGADGRANPTAQWCMMICGVLLFLLIAGNILYATQA